MIIADALFAPFHTLMLICLLSLSFLSAVFFHFLSHFDMPYYFFFLPVYFFV